MQHTVFFAPMYRGTSFRGQTLLSPLALFHPIYKTMYQLLVGIRK